jgi:hypothetical protein
MNLPEIKKIIDEKITGVWEPRHTEFGHRYCHLPSGKMVDSVTSQLQILGRPHLIPWAVKMGALWLMEGDRAQKLLNPNATEAMIQGMQMASTDFRDTAGKIGSFSHSFLERYCNEFIHNGERPESIMKFIDISKDDPNSIAAARAGEELMKKYNVIPIASEIICGDPRYSAGQIDLICLWEGKDLCILDWKSSNNVSQDYILQTVAYLKFWEYMTGIKVKKLKIAHLSKNTNKYTIYNVKNIRKSWKAFKNVCEIYKWKVDKNNKLEKDIKRLAI